MSNFWKICLMDFRSLAFLVSFLCFSSSLAAPTQNCHSNDFSALKEFSSQFLNESVKLSWSSDTSCCEWEGVICEDNGNVSAERRVISLHLSGKGLKGVLSESLCRLDMLRSLDLSHNLFGSGLPSGFSNLKQLRFIDLSHNSLSGLVFNEIFGLNAVNSVYPFSSSFSRSLYHLGIFPSLVAFNISNNFFAGELNSEICYLSDQIQVLDLSSNHFTGGIEGLDYCNASLEQLHIDFNSLSGELPSSLYFLSALKHLTIAGNNFSGPISDKIANLTKLRTLILAENRFSGSLPNVFWKLTELEQFIAHSNSFSGSLPNTLASCSKLWMLDLRNNSFSGPIGIDFTQMHDLCSLELSSNYFSGSLPESLSSCQELHVLSLAKNSLTGQIPESYKNLSSLSFLSLSNNSLVNITGSLSVLKHCRNLTTLILTKNFQGEEIPENVSGFENLSLLALGNCGLNGEIPNWLLNCRKLQVLDLSWNSLHGSIPSWIGEMSNLFYLDFSNNSLTGALPEGMTELKSLISLNIYNETLSPSTGIPLFVKRNKSANGLQYNQASSFPPSLLLSNNKISGSILPEIGRLKQLHVLDLSRNNITGSIPNSISNMRNLELLDLSFNNLHGSIPLSFSKLTFLSKFSVANNHLEGAIPTGGQFLSFPSSSFEGNPGLCGKLITPCAAFNASDPQSSTTSQTTHRKFGQGSIIALTISIGIGLALLFLVIFLTISRRNAGLHSEDVEEISRAPRLSNAFVPPKLVLFKDADCKDLSTADLLKSTNNFHQSNIVGCGGFGLVYKADLPNGAKVAIKRLSGDCGQMEREFQAEVEALSRARHKNLVSLQGYCLFGNDRLLIYSFMENGSLDYWLHEKVDGSSFLTCETRLKIAQGAAHGLAYLHKVPNIVHRDIKTSNILLDDKFEAHLADFGLSRLLHPHDTHVTTDLVGTLGYIPPEYSQTLTATFRGDIYSFGVVLLELITGRRPVEVCKGKNCRDLVVWMNQKKVEQREEEIFDSALRHKDCINQLMEVLGVACKCIDQDPRRRPSIDEVVSLLDKIETGKS